MSRTLKILIIIMICGIIFAYMLALGVLNREIETGVPSYDEKYALYKMTDDSGRISLLMIGSPKGITTVKYTAPVAVAQTSDVGWLSGKTYDCYQSSADGEVYIFRYEPKWDSWIELRLFRDKQTDELYTVGIETHDGYLVLDYEEYALFDPEQIPQGTINKIQVF